ncbi:eamA-like transporter family protein [Yersinia pseudotuberculosis IP 32953]|uniref:Threonine/homoserine exporter RhtA n=2 Tax=Yersinia pseudotuberculosis TaxID=633 RepID=Q66D49_YERPS|nr:eamA-like transporter family protein [Yersinia pseudotuberculosis]AJJ54586.1 eamA-like transporter family protein [Yersinia pseudotuberculosis IP 32953]AJJ06886.1 eamA-like transporter family protein [Yersinia pseudotuberculosis]MBO1553476.1 EamA family transporter [Yersinia pseudotuberculosis]MBO1563628.1 EamA family transporter [Yersinia pseudotuberculosis]
MTTRVLKAHLQMLGFTALLGGSFIASATISNALPPMVITWLRYAIASLFFVVLLVSQGLLTLPHYRDLGRYTLISLPPLLYFACMIFSLQTTSTINSSALYTTVPLMSMVMSVVFLNSKSTWPVVAALLLGILGALLIIFKGDLSQVLHLSLMPSDYLFLFGCLGMALNPIVVKKLHRGEHALVLTGWSLICATLLLTVIIAYQLPEIEWRNISVITWSGVLYLATFATALSFFLFQKACIVLSPTKVSGYVYLIPLSVIVTNMMLGQTINWQEIASGAILVIIAMAILVKAK